MSVTAILVLYRARKPPASGRSLELAGKLPNLINPAFRRSPTIDGRFWQRFLRGRYGSASSLIAATQLPTWPSPIRFQNSTLIGGRRRSCRFFTWCGQAGQGGLLSHPLPARGRRIAAPGFPRRDVVHEAGARGYSGAFAARDVWRKAN